MIVMSSILRPASWVYFVFNYREIGGGQGAGVAGVVEGGRGQPPPQGGDEAHLETDHASVIRMVIILMTRITNQF